MRIDLQFYFKIGSPDNIFTSKFDDRLDQLSPILIIINNIVN